MSDQELPGPYQPTQPPGGPPPPAPGPGLPPVRAVGPPGGPAYPDPAGSWPPPQPVAGKSRVVAILLALFLGGIGIHKFYLGKIAQGVIYLVFFWTGVPALIAWIEAIRYLLKSNEAWALEHGGPVERPPGITIGCLWLVAILPLLWIVAFVAIVALIFLGSQTTPVYR